MPKSKNTQKKFAVFIDGRYFLLINNYYQYVSKQKKGFHLPSFMDFLKDSVAKSLGLKPENIVFIQNNLFMGLRFEERQAFESEERGKYEEAKINCHILPLKQIAPGKWKEQGVDVLLTSLVLELVFLGETDGIILMTGDGDFTPLVNIVRKQNKEVILCYCNIDQGEEYSEKISTSRELVQCANESINIGNLVEAVSPKIFEGDQKTPEEALADKIPTKETMDIAKPKKPSKSEVLEGVVTKRIGRFIFIKPKDGSRGVYHTVGEEKLPKIIPGKEVEYVLGENGKATIFSGKKIRKRVRKKVPTKRARTKA